MVILMGAFSVAVMLIASAITLVAQPPISVLSPYTVISFTEARDTRIISLIAGDFDRDGKGDIGVLSRTSNSFDSDLTIYSGKADGTMAVKVDKPY